MNRLSISAYIVLLLLMIPCLTSAQLGVKAGIGVTDIAFKKHGQSPYLGFENNSVVHNYPMLSYQIGLITTHRLHDRWVLQPELLYTKKGLDYSMDFIYDNITFKVNIHYLQLPVLVRYRLGTKAHKRTDLYGGPNGGLALHAIRKLKFEGQEDIETMDNVRNGDVGVQIGILQERSLDRGRLIIDFRLSYSLINMMDRIEGHISEYNRIPNPYARNIGIMLSLGYVFDFSSKKNSE